jgi:tRNA(Ile)-lysidine synthase
VCYGAYDAVVLGLSLPSPCPFPPFHGEFPVKVPGETILPGWRVTAGISSVIPRQSPEHSESRPPFVIASEAKQSQQKGRSVVAEFDLHRVGTELFVRQRQPGDRFQPLGMDMTKKLKDFMIDAKIPLTWRESIPLVCSREQIIWVVGWRINDRAKVTENTKEILRLEFIRL